MTPTLDVLVLTDDEALQSELRISAVALGDEQPKLRFAADHGALLDAVRTRPPRLVLAPLEGRATDVARLARELAVSEPPIPVAAIFRPNGLGDDVSESTVLIEAMRAGVQDFLRRPISAGELRALLDRLAGARPTTSASPASSVGRVISFISNKGGVGKSTLAVNTAVGLAARFPGRVLLIDGSLQMGVAAALLDVAPETTLSDAARERDRLDVTMLRQIATQTPSGVHLLAAPPDAVEAMEVDDGLMSRIITLGRRAYDFVIVDTFPMFDRVVVATLDLSDRTYVVMENVVPTLLGAIKLLDVLERIGIPASRQSLIVNRDQPVAGTLPLADVAARLNRSIDHVFPFDKRVIEAANSGSPVGTHSGWLGWSRFSRAMSRLVEEVASLDVRANESITGASAAPSSIANDSNSMAWSDEQQAAEVGANNISSDDDRIGV